MSKNLSANLTDDYVVNEGRLKQALHSLIRNKLGFIGFLIIVLTMFVALFAPIIAPYNPSEINYESLYIPPTWLEGGSLKHILGTDNLGRDVLSRVIYGSRISMIVGVLAVVLSGAIGVFLGLIAGYRGGIIDNILMRIVDAFLSIPNILFMLVILGVIGPSITTLIIVLGVTNWIIYARLVRSEVLSLKNADFIIAAISMGTKTSTIIRKHILPNVFSSVIVISTLSVGTTIILEASLSFLGLGVQPPSVSWGGMLNEGRDHLATSWWISTFPGICITTVVLGFIFFGDWLRDYLDPKSR